MEQLLGLLNALQSLSPELAAHLSAILKHRQYKKKDHLLREGMVSNHVYFVEQGLLRAYTNNGKGEVITNWFMKEGDVIFSVESFLEQQPSLESIVALEEVSVYYISYEELSTIYQLFPEFNYHGRVLTEKYYTLSLKRGASIKKKTAQERYHLLLQQEPHLLKRAPLQDIASYLGMSPEMLSKVRSAHSASNN